MSLSHKSAQQRTASQKGTKVQAPEQPIFFTKEAYVELLEKRKKSELDHSESRQSPSRRHLQQIPSHAENDEGRSERKPGPSRAEKIYVCRPGFFLPLHYCFLFHEYLQMHNEWMRGLENTVQRPPGEHLQMQSPAQRKRRSREESPSARRIRFYTEPQSRDLPGVYGQDELLTQRASSQIRSRNLPTYSVWRYGDCPACLSTHGERSAWKPPNRAGGLFEEGLENGLGWGYLPTPPDTRSESEAELQPDELIWCNKAECCPQCSAELPFDTQNNVYNDASGMNFGNAGTGYNGMEGERESWARLVKTLLSCRRLEKNIESQLTVLDLYGRYLPNDVCSTQDLLRDQVVQKCQSPLPQSPLPPEDALREHRGQEHRS